jgi:hypothetical protein
MGSLDGVAGTARRASHSNSLPIVVAQITVTGDRAHVPLENAERRRSIAEKMVMPEHEELWPKSFRTSIDTLSTYDLKWRIL